MENNQKKNIYEYIYSYICIYLVIYTYVYESFCCIPETNTTLQINYTSIKKKRLVGSH